MIKNNLLNILLRNIVKVIIVFTSFLILSFIIINLIIWLIDIINYISFFISSWLYIPIFILVIVIFFYTLKFNNIIVSTLEYDTKFRKSNNKIIKRLNKSDLISTGKILNYILWSIFLLFFIYLFLFFF